MYPFLLLAFGLFSLELPDFLIPMALNVLVWITLGYYLQLAVLRIAFYENFGRLALPIKNAKINHCGNLIVVEFIFM